MATATYVPIATQTLSSAASSITFSSIPSTYTDLRLVVVPIAPSGSFNLFIKVNGDSSALYSRTWLTGIGTSGASSNSTTGGTYWNIIANNGFVTTPTLYTLDFFSYAGSTYKTALITSNEEENDATASNNALSRMVGLYRSTSAVTSIVISSDAGNNFATGTTATLWGI